MSIVFIYVIGAVLAGVGLWTHDWRCLCATPLLALGAWILSDVDSCVERSLERGEDDLPPVESISKTAVRR